MQLVIHSPFGSRLNRAWGLALRKRFCRSFNFELQAAATDDAIVLSLGTQHSFPLEEVFRYLNTKTVRDLLTQALLDAPMFAIRWRWNATRALALPRQRGGIKVPAPLQRMESENLLAAVFPDQLACLENIAGDREIPGHPLVQQTIEDCLTEAMDVDGLIDLLSRIESGAVELVARDLPEPSPLAHEILNAKPYAFLDNAPLEERRTQAVYTRRAGESSADAGLGILDIAAIKKVCQEAWPRVTSADELHETLLLTGALTDEEVRKLTSDWKPWLDLLGAEKRAGKLMSPNPFWIAAERLPMLQMIYPGCHVEPSLAAPQVAKREQRQWERCGRRSRTGAGTNGSDRTNHRERAGKLFPVVLLGNRGRTSCPGTGGFYSAREISSGHPRDRMVRPASPGANSPADHQPAAGGDSAGVNRGVPAFLAGVAASGCGASRRGT